MFTGLVEEVARIKSIKRSKYGLRLTIDSRLDTTIGSSIAVDGVCLTVTDKDNSYLSFDIMPASIKDTSFSHLKTGSLVNLERAMKADSRFDGHIVSGHVDTISKIIKIKKGKDGTAFYIDLKKEFHNLIFKKSSIAVSGISLTVQEVTSSFFRVNIIPHSLDNTSLKFKKTDDIVNVEFDMLLKQNESLKNEGKITSKWMRSLGY